MIAPQSKRTQSPDYPIFKKRMKARGRALNRLARLHRAEFERLLEEEERNLGVPLPRAVSA